MANRNISVILIVLLFFCVMWIIAADNAIHVLHLEAERASLRNEILKKKNDYLERSLIEARTQLNTTTRSYFESTRSIDSLSRKFKASKDDNTSTDFRRKIRDKKLTDL